MAWSAALSQKILDQTNGNIIATVVFTSSDGSTQVRTIPGTDLSDDILAAFCGNYITILNNRDAAIAALTLGPIAPPVVDPAQLALQQAQQAQQAAVAAYAQQAQLVSLGLAQSTDDTVVAAQAAAVASIASVTSAKAAISVVAKPILNTVAPAL